MLQKISNLLEEINSLNISTVSDLESFRLKFLSKKGIISELFEDFRQVPPNEKKEVGQKLNSLKQSAQDKYNLLKESLTLSETTTVSLDTTRTPFPYSSGSRHPISIVRNEIIEIFSRVGFTVSEGPEIEDDDHVFTKLNFAPEHPARDMQDTFYISRLSLEESSPDDILLRTQTSSVPR
jgi:phenylalanyl-tRNA synthetase alpha chain